MSDYKPGTVAHITVSDIAGVDDYRAVKDDKGWASLDPGIGWAPDSSVTDVRPLVVIDPEDDEQAAQFARGYIAAHAYSGTPWEKREQEARDRVIAAVQAGFRAAAEPPKPETSDAHDGCHDKGWTDVDGVRYCNNCGFSEGARFCKAVRP